MRAFALESFDSPATIIEVPTPPVPEGHLLVRVEASSINGFDLSVASGRLQGMIEYEFPVILGKDFAGAIEAIGSDVADFAVGDRVFGVVADPSPLHTRAHAEYLIVPAGANVVRIPDGVDVATAGVLGLAGAAALQAVDAIAPQPGETVLISGATGGVGTLAIQLVKARDAAVIATAKADGADLVAGLGADHVVDYSGDLAEQVQVLRPDGVDAILHFAGDGTTVGALLAPGGRLASTQIMAADQLPLTDAQVFPIFANADAATLARLADEVAAGRLKASIQQTYPLEQLGEAFAAFGKGTRGKIAISIPS